jgi:glycosyltransferase involved in cell wall biosynthesis
LLCQWAENTACRDADRVVSMLPKVHPYLAAHGLDLAKLHIVPNGVAPEDWVGTPPPLRADVQAAIDAAHADGAVLVGYAGSMGLPNALDTLLEAFGLLRTASAAAPLRLLMVGDGHERERLAQRIAAEGLTHVHLLPPIPKAQVRTLLAQIDIAYLGWQRVSLYRFGIAPNKLMDYMMAGCAVLHSVEAGNDPVQDAGCGLTVPPGDARAVAEGLRRLAGLSAEERRAMGERGRVYVQKHHTWPVLAQRFIEAIR